MDQIYDCPLKFILYIDDLTFSAGDDSFSVLKATLEGTVSARPDNAVIYATGNRQNLIGKDDAEGSAPDPLAARFGLRVCFMRPERDTYLAFTRQLAEQMGLRMDPETLSQKAEDFAARSGGRSPRAAKQLVEQLLAEQ